MTDNTNKDNERNPQNKGGIKKPQLGYKKNPYNWIIIAVLIMTLFMIGKGSLDQNEIRWDEFRSYLGQDYISKVRIDRNRFMGEFSDDALESLPSGTKKQFYVNYIPLVNGEILVNLLDDVNARRQEDGKPPVEVKVVESKDWIYGLLSFLLPILLLVFIFYFVFARNMKGGAGGMLMSFGRSKHKMHGKDKVKVTFKDVAGIEEAKDEVTEIIEFLKNPKKFQRLGGRIPRGVLLMGPPGCGKTLLAKAMAGQADVPFFSISGSDFVEMFVGVGASRVRDLFKQAKENSPCIIFLDEIDAIGRKRGASFASGGHDEREQTLNAILVEMDGFETNDQVIVVAATNRGDILDKALTRPGRFDRQVVVPLPDLKGRAQILKVHSEKVILGPDANLERLARGTPMFSGADLAAIINEAALLATMEEKDCIEMVDLEESRDKVRWGRSKKSRTVDKQDKEITAYHEAGHTLVQSLLKDADPLHKVSIIPRGPMGGATFALPEKDRTMFTKKYLIAQLQICYAGRIAEELFCDDISSGASADIEQATSIAKQMVLILGMSDDLGLINYGPDNARESFVLTGEKEYSDSTAEKIDIEIRKITQNAYDKAKVVIQENSEKLEAIAQALLKYETLDAAEVKIILDGGTINKPTVGDLLAAEQKKSEQASENDSPNPSEEKDSDNDENTQQGTEDKQQ